MNMSFINPFSGGFGKNQKPPPAPDFAGAAAAQGTANVETARVQGQMNNPNINDPYGSQTVSWEGDRPTVTRALNPEQQALLDQQTRISGAVGTTAEQGVGRVNTAMGKEFDLSGAPNRINTVAGSPLQTNLNLGTNFAGGIDTGGTQRQLDTNGLPAPSFNFNRGQVQGTVAGAGEDARKAVEQAMYSRSTARLDPRFAQSDDNLRSNLVAQGLHEGTTAWDRAMQNQSMAKNDAYSSAMNDAITAGGAEQSRQFGMNMGAGQFTNQAQAQEAGQNLQAANLSNNAQAQEFGQKQAEGTFANAATGQDFGQRAQNVNLVNNALVARNAATLQGGQFQNSAAGQQFNQGVTNANMTNAGRQQAIQEEAYLRQLPLQELNSLRTGAQPNMPQFQNYQGSQIAPPPVFNAVQAQDQGAVDRYNAQMGTQNAQMQGMSQAAMAAAMYFSDRRVKRKIRQIGNLPSGLPWYEFEYIWGGGVQEGVMADEVEMLFPDAVKRTPFGILMVDYRRIG